ncbi:MAG: DegV family protein [Ruminococcus sp.]|nr:DegV family protein [Ruminococcus sp.]
MIKYGDYVLLTDTTCDLPAQVAEEYGFDAMPMVFLMNEKVYHHYLDAREMKLDDFYARLRAGELAQTTQISYQDYFDYFEPYLDKGKDILYICFTSGLSGTYNTCKIAIRELKQRYPDRTIRIIDSSCASVGQGLLVYLAAKMFKEEQPALEELERFVEDTKTECCHWFVVDDIDQLKRGGRISSLTATFAKALQIKPVLSVDNDGKLVNVGKIRGANNVYDMFIKKLQRDGRNLGEQTVIIGHASNFDGAEELKKKVKPFVKDVKISEIGPVIGTHVGTGMLALAFLGERKFEM